MAKVSFRLRLFIMAFIMLATFMSGLYSQEITASAATTAVSAHGRLSVKGSKIVDKNSNAFQLIGMSTHGIAWYPEAISEQTIRTLRDDWGINAFRLAMYTEEYGGYTTSPENKNAMINRVNKGVEIAKKLGMYVIIDWHILNDNNPQTHKAEAVAFFKQMSSKYKDCPNVLYEICNEPHWVSWASDIKPYCIEVIKAIRKNDPNAIIICGSNTWSQDIHEVLQNPITGYKNIAYSLHFYANTHTQWLRDRLVNCLDNGLCVLVTEFGTCDASGNGGFNKAETDNWLKLLQSRKVGFFNWSLSNKEETASAFLPGTDLSRIKAGESQLTQSGKLIRSWTRKISGAKNVTSSAPKKTTPKSTQAQPKPVQTQPAQTQPVQTQPVQTQPATWNVPVQNNNTATSKANTNKVTTTKKVNTKVTSECETYKSDSMIKSILSGNVKITPVYLADLGVQKLKEALSRQ